MSSSIPIAWYWGYQQKEEKQLMYKKQYIFTIDFIANSSVLCGCLELKLCFMPVVINMLYFNIFLLIALISEAIAKTV